MQQAIFIVVAILTAVFVQLYHMNKLNKKFIDNNQYFRNDKYWTAERFSILSSLVFIIIFSLGFPYAVIKYHIDDLYQIIAYALSGGIGNGAFIYFLGRSDRYLKKQIDNQTNTNNE